MSRILLIALFLLPPAYLFYLIFLYFFTHVPYVATPKKRLVSLMEHMAITKETIIYDLGSGKGDVLFAAEQFHPKKLIGYELSPLHVWYTRFKAWMRQSNVRVYRQNFFTANIGEADIIYLFLVQSVVEKMWKKIQKEAKPGATIVVLSNTIPNQEGTFHPLLKDGVATPGGIHIYTIPLTESSLPCTPPISPSASHTPTHYHTTPG
ncbi:MAG: hypothetical protein A3G08_01295 [Candidatus Magasanikbacteria bacterium RIFCSPLOWO2_12_FULL_47_9b]|nr:MAG: hypothetical protein A3I74_01970 [Candidatus Magasanikbacteria bacterium RIFCSPLOWO2_02_FULL_47_16]OGH79812.1 MAG: hypothetical protein A3C10_05120 [Candidatus Magasanikbacteria bacterium RIFCSPHIGHO2_02_FULL_48_18]OGH83034.1 MAG: hypothetical protein A3G08_01295 [Candidatus Magasanikbacteria bacterium RIFCSPLOWO2_12_FULL_47_9b]